MMAIEDFIEKNMKLAEKPIKLYEYQKKFLRDKSKHRIVNKSRQVGMSQVMAWEALAYCLAERNVYIGVVSVGQKQAENVLRMVKDAYHSLPNNIKENNKLLHERADHLEFSNGTHFLSLPNNPRTVRGYHFHRLYIDEYAHIERDSELSDAILPTTTRGGRITYMSTPLGKRGEFYRIWDSEKTTASKHEIHHKECPDFDLTHVLEKYPDGENDPSFRQEYCCEFIDDSVSLFPWDLIMRCVDSDIEEESNMTKYKEGIVAGVDFGKKIDSTVVIIVKRNKDNVWEIKLTREFMPPTTYTEASDFIKRNYKEWNVSKIRVDQTGLGDSVIEQLYGIGSIVEGIKLSNPVKDTIIQNLKVMMQDGKIRFPNNNKLKLQLHSLRKSTSETGMIRYSHPREGEIQHDDYVWALALAVYQGDYLEGLGSPPVCLKGSILGLGKSEERYSDFRRIPY
jgi:phage FluMu gp28-like protein